LDTSQTRRLDRDFASNRDYKHNLIKLGREIRQMRDQTAELERKTLEQIETQIRELDDKINRTQVLDLVPAIIGLGISALGTLFVLGV
jgi:hypothetical protein